MERALARAACLLCAAALTLGRVEPMSAATTAQRPQPVIIDTDIGDDIDDAFAVAIALGDPRLEVIGITTAWGDTRTRTLLVRRLLATVGRQDVVVAQGPTTANTVPFTQRKWAIGAADTTPAPDAIEFIREQARNRPGEITLIALAPLSNIEALQRRDPEALHKRQLGHSCAGLELPAQKELPEAEKRSRRLRGAVCVSAHALLRGNHTAGPNCIQEGPTTGLNARLTASEPTPLHTSDITFSIGRRVAGGGADSYSLEEEER